MVERVVLHVGPHKTGSTALQEAFAMNATHLRACGVLYPETGRSGSAHQNVARGCWTDGDPVLDVLRDEIADARMVFLSSELFSALDLKGLRRLAGLFGDAPVEIVYVLRRLPLLLQSHWRELIKHGQPLTFPDYLDLARDIAPHPQLAAPMPAAQLGRLEQVFGSEGLRLIVYDARRTDRARYGVDFIDDALGLGQIAARFETSEFNLTAPGWQVELGRHLNILAGTSLRYSQKFSLRNLMIARIDDAPPDWLDDFKAAYAAADPEVISDQTPFVQEQVTTVLDRYGDYLIDAADAYTAPVTAEVRSLSPAHADPALNAAVKALYGALLLEVPEDAEV